MAAAAAKPVGLVGVMVCAATGVAKTGATTGALEAVLLGTLPGTSIASSPAPSADVGVESK